MIHTNEVQATLRGSRRLNEGSGRVRSGRVWSCVDPQTVSFFSRTLLRYVTYALWHGAVHLAVVCLSLLRLTRRVELFGSSFCTI